MAVVEVVVLEVVLVDDVEPREHPPGHDGLVGVEVRAIVTVAAELEIEGGAAPELGLLRDVVDRTARLDLAIQQGGGTLDDFDALHRGHVDVGRAGKTVAHGIRVETAHGELRVASVELAGVVRDARRKPRDVLQLARTDILDELLGEGRHGKWQILDRRVDAGGGDGIARPVALVLVGGNLKRRQHNGLIAGRALRGLRPEDDRDEQEAGGKKASPGARGRGGKVGVHRIISEGTLADAARPGRNSEPSLISLSR